MRINSGEVLLEAIKKNGVMPYNEIVVDGDYVFPTKEWMVTKFSEAFKVFLRQLDALGYKVDKNDCDNFAVHCYSFALLLHNRDPKAYQKGFAMGMYHYTTDKGTGHAINIFVTVDPDTNTYEVAFYEPQTQSIVRLSEQEKASCRTLFI